MNSYRLLAAALAAAMVLSALAPIGTVAADEHGDELTVTVDENVVTVESNDSAVDNATVDVSVADENDSYDGAGEYTTDDNGTVVLPEPEENVTVAITATDGNETAATTATLEPVEEEEPENFGALVSAFVENEKNDSDGQLGLAVASFVVENNPGNAPDHAGPPSHAGPPGDDGKEKPQGPPDHAGPSDDDDDDDRKNGNGNGGGPPGHANSSD